ncbi:MAG: WD40-repeat-containing domain protein [Monoraphidium minutum]|nr:MAG: WD40-repeat-containing domain protein [Monoraphidium minutum]
MRTHARARSRMHMRAAAPQEPVLRAKLKAHSASLTAALVVIDEPGRKEIATASLDKTLATWQIQRSEVAGAPVFSLLAAAPPAGGASAAAAGAGAVWCGLATKEIASWTPGSPALSELVRVNGHTGWVRALAASGRYLFSCGCNHLRQWDTTYTVPKEVSDHSLFTGDILALAATRNRVFTAGADGSVRAWALGGACGGAGGSGGGGGHGGCKDGELKELASREKAHDGRVTALAVAGNLVFSVSYDGRIKGWDTESLHLVVKRSAAHGGARIQCAAVGGDGLLYTGGDDGLVRRWDPVELEPVGPPLDGHGGASVRVLAAGRPGGDCLVSGDASGEVAVWAV